MRNVIMYSRIGCGFCEKAKQILAEKGVSFEERLVGPRYSKTQLHEHCGKLTTKQITTVPQIIFVDDGIEKYIGGYSDLASIQNTL